MDNFEDEIKSFASKVSEKIKHIDSEETTKTALILPFIQLMGYDTTNPQEVKAEYTADLGAKQGEKIDLAILRDTQEVILVECKSVNTKLSKNHLSQLLRYFNITDSEIGILTNGIVYQFFTDSKNNGKMDKSPFLEIDLRDLTEKEIFELNKFTKDNFDISKIRNRMDDLKYSHDIHEVLANEIESPTDEFVRVIAKQVYDGVITANVRKKFYEIIKKEFKEVINEKVDLRLKEAIENNKEDIPDELKNLDKDSEIETTKEEFEGYYIIKSIVSEVVNPERVTIKDTKSYCNVLLDDNSHYPIARMYFNKFDNLRLQLFDSFEKSKRGSRKGEMVPIKNLKEIYNYKENLVKTAKIYDRNIKRKARK